MKRNKITLCAAAIIVTTALVSTRAMAHETTSGQSMSATQNAGSAKDKVMKGMKTDGTMEDGGQCKIIPGKGMGPEPTNSKGMNHGKSKGHKMGGGKTAKMIKSMMPTMMKHIGMNKQDMGAKKMGAKNKKQAQGQNMMSNMKIMMPKMMQHLGMEKQKMAPGKS